MAGVIDCVGKNICSDLAPCAALINFRGTDATTCAEFCGAHRLGCADANDELQIRQVDVVMRRPDDVLVVAGLKAGERVITSAVAVPLPGLKLAPRTEGAGRVSSGSRQEAGR